jgi:hypothetical protein
MADLLEKILDNPKNESFFHFVKLERTKQLTLRPAVEINGYDQGGQIFFDEYAEDLPEETKRIIDITRNILVNEQTGEIFAFHFGRFTFAFKCDFEKNNFADYERFQTGTTLDDFVDIRELGPEWALLDRFCEDEQEQLGWAYDLTKEKTASSE